MAIEDHRPLHRALTRIATAGVAVVRVFMPVFAQAVSKLKILWDVELSSCQRQDDVICRPNKT